MNRLTWNRFSRRGEITHHAILHHVRPGGVQALHTHAFAEVFWGIEGRGRHVINGKEGEFGVGDLVLLRPHDNHEFCADRGEDCLYYLVSFPARLLRMLAIRYGDEGAAWLDSSAPPLQMHVTPLLREWLDAAIPELLATGDDRLAIERFLLNLLYELRHEEDDPFTHCPAWLRRAIVELQHPDQFAYGARALAVLSGRSAEHVSRTLRRCTGMTPSRVINRIRLEYAAGQLILTQQPILDIALACGFRSLGHFYSAFGKQYGCPPRQYRLRNRREIGE
jgi:AraC family transcriptional regulator, dual regulator of chb operon